MGEGACGVLCGRPDGLDGVGDGSIRDVGGRSWVLAARGMGSRACLGLSAEVPAVSTARAALSSRWRGVELDRIRVSPRIPRLADRALQCEVVESSVTVAWIGCGECGYSDPSSGRSSVCPKCGAPPAVDDENRIQIPLTFSAAACPNCGTVGPGGSCESCGVEVPTPEPDDATRARAKALGPLRERAHKLTASFDEFPQSHIPVTAGQLISVVVDADLPNRAISLIHFAHRVGSFELATPAAIGTRTRRDVIAILDEVERVRDEARRVAAFRPPDDLLELPPLLARLAQQGSRVVAWTIEAISAETLAEAQAAVVSLQSSLTAPPEADRISELLDACPGLVGREDLDARASLALGIEGEYADEFGLVDPVRLFAAASTEASPMSVLAFGAGRYLSHLLDTPPEELPPGAGILALGAVQLAALDRPFGPHRQAELVRELLSRASGTEPEDLAAALSLYDEDQGRVFAAATRARRAMRRLAAGEVDEPVDVVESALSIYRRLAEGSFRTCMRFLLAIRAAVEGRPTPSESLLLGEIDGLLDGWHDELGDSLRGAVERDLRNAEAHEDFHIDPASLEVVTAERRVSPSMLEEALTCLTATLAAIEAAILCYRIDSRDTYELPQWLVQGEHPDAVAMLLASVAAAYGLELSRVDRDGDDLTLTIEESPAGGVQKTRMLLVAAAPLAPTAQVLSAEANGQLVTAISSDTIRAWQMAHTDEQDLALIELLFDSHVRSGVPAPEAFTDALTAEVRLLLNVDIPAVAHSPTAHAALSRLARRLRRICRFANAQRAILTPTLSQVIADLRLTRDAAQAAVLNPASLPDVFAPLQHLEEWSAARGTLPDDYAGDDESARE